MSISTTKINFKKRSRNKKYQNKHLKYYYRNLQLIFEIEITIAFCIFAQ
ncbi:hypothetical protein FEM21_20110 [Flavobacterium seoulense]|uniref:Uncharacterized protein n=1 Tax=Flavobacterium seoulense TaxID=1492738 RepID=A0A066WMD1_9FLAO|nr:hypothetical protein FEM21_20110 [Flavobacterium seoulense]